MTQQNIGRQAGAKSMVLAMIENDLQRIGQSDQLDAKSPDPRDPHKFVLAGRAGKIIHARDGFYLKINLGWLEGDREPPEVWSFPFHWYAFAVPRGKGFSERHYFLCSYTELRSWVLEFDAPTGDDHADDPQWRGAFEFVSEDRVTVEAYFRWGDETPGEHSGDSRFIQLDNVVEILGRGSVRGSDSRISPDDSSDPLGPPAPPEDDPDKRVLQLVRQRRGAEPFRRMLRDLYEDRCAVTGYGPPDVLEAAHIQPHTKEGRNSADNGLLLRADIHTLFDAGLIWFEPGTMAVRIAPSIQGSPYSELEGRQLRGRTDGSQPNRRYLEERSPTWVR